MTASKAKPRAHLRAVGWMGGPDVLARLGVILRKAQRPNGWMHIQGGYVHDETGKSDGRLRPIKEEAASSKRAGETDSIEKAAAATRQTSDADAHPIADAAEPQEPDETIWFDYVSDLGDDTDSMYAVAYACNVGLTPQTERDLEVGDVLLRQPERTKRGPHTLPRGRFLFLGGDTAYHVADTVTLTRRVRDPFEWAHDDAHGPAPKKGKLPRLYGIPGNHDWYDHLDGFAKVFRRDHPEKIELKGFQPAQIASYAAIKLPFGWQLWGLDIYPGLDVEQEAYFKSLAPLPAKLILCTPSPPRAFHSVEPATHHDESLESLGIPRLYDPKCTTAGGRVQLDLSGDVHHYARYEGPPGYTSIVAGLGGAFHHPSFTTHTRPHPTKEPAREYPTHDDSLLAVGRRLLQPTTMLVGSWFRALPMAIGLVFGFAALLSPAAQWLLHGILSWVPGSGALGIPLGDATHGLRSLVAAGVFLLACGLVVGAVLLFRVVSRKQTDDPDIRITVPDRRLLSEPWRVLHPYRSYWLSTVLVLAAIALLAILPSMPFAPTSEHTILDVGTLVLGLGTIAGAVAFAGKVGSKGLAWHRRVGVSVLLGGIHGLVQLSTPFVFAVCSTLSLETLAAALGLNIAIALLLWASRFLFRNSALPTAVMTLLAVGAWLATIVTLIHLAGGATFTPPTSSASRAFAVILGAALSIPACCCFFTWYLAIAALCDAHNNEAGGAARVTEFRQIIRFKLDASGLTGHVIAIKSASSLERGELANGTDPEKKLQFVVVDRFEIKAPAAPG